MYYSIFYTTNQYLQTLNQHLSQIRQEKRASRHILYNNVQGSREQVKATGSWRRHFVIIMTSWPKLGASEENTFLNSILKFAVWLGTIIHNQNDNIYNIVLKNFIAFGSSSQNRGNQPLPPSWRLWQYRNREKQY